MKKIIIALLLCSTPSFAYFLIDDVMSRSMQKRTGVINLNHNEKLALEEWLNETFTLKALPAPQVPQDLYIMQNINNGRKLRLSDNSLWEVSPNDISTAALWIMASPLKIQDSNDPDYPSLLINSYTEAGIKCRQIEPPNSPK